MRMYRFDPPSIDPYKDADAQFILENPDYRGEQAPDGWSEEQVTQARATLSR